MPTGKRQSIGSKESRVKTRWWLILAVVLAALLRFWQLGVNPPALSWDEAAWGYNGYALGLDGQDEFGRFLPLDYLESFGDFKPPVYAYLTVLPVKVFGLNELATRFPSALFGVLTVLAVYFLVLEIFRNSAVSRQLSTVTSLLLAVSPWHIMLSRAAFEANVASFFIIAGVTLFLIGVRKTAWFLIPSAVCFALSLHTFNTARIVTPLLVVFLAWAFKKNLWQKKRWSVLSFLTGLLIILPAIGFYLTPQARLRYQEVNIFSDPEVVLVANQEMANDGWAWWSLIIHNRRWGYARSFLTHFFDHFKPSFLFIKGDGNPKFSTQDTGQLYLWELPFLVAGFLFLIRKKPGVWRLLPFWLVAGILPAAVARETPHALRIETTLPVWQILSSLGMVWFWRAIQKKKAWVKNGLMLGLGGIILVNFLYFQHGYWSHYPIEYSGEWQYGYKPAIDFINQAEKDYDQVWFANQLGRPYIYLLYYLEKNPREFRQEAVIRRDVFGFVKVESFGKYHFFRPEETPRTSGRALVINGPGRIPGGGLPLKTFYLLNGQEVLEAYEI